MKSIEKLNNRFYQFSLKVEMTLAHKKSTCKEEFLFNKVNELKWLQEFPQVYTKLNA